MTSARTSLVIRRLQMVIGLQMQDVLRPLDLTPAQYALLSIVAHRPALSATQLARRLGVKLPTIAEFIATLERKKWISRAEDQNNRRVLRILITPAGRKLLAQSERLVNRLEARLFGVLQPREFERFHRAAVTILRAANLDASRRADDGSA
ncbi:MAG: MarR family winged helix-turn-helix transcriptional regulator [Stellaceae bacterium]